MPPLYASTPRIRTSNSYTFKESRPTDNRIGYCYAFHLIVGGSGEVTIGNKSYSVNPGKLLFIPPLVEHKFISTVGNPYTSLNIYSDLWCDQNWGHYPHVASVSAINDQYFTPVMPCEELEQLPTLFNLQTNPFMIDLCTHIIQLTNSNIIHHKNEIINSLFYSWLLEFYSHALSNHHIDYRITKIVKLIEQNGKEDYAEWFELTKLNKSHFFKLFKSTTGVTPKTYVLRVKMRQAATLLIESNDSITEIAELLGFSTVHYFTNVFTKFFGESPTTFRKAGLLRYK